MVPAAPETPSVVPSQYEQQVQARLLKIEALNKDLAGARWRDVLKAMRLLAHQISGASVSLGKAEVSRVSLALFEVVSSLMNYPSNKLSHAQIAAVNTAVLRLRQILTIGAVTLDDNEEDLDASLTSVVDNRAIYILDKKDPHNIQLTKQMGYFGYKPTIIRTQEEMLAMVEENVPACIVIGDAKTPLEYKGVIEKIQEGRDHRIPVVLMAHEDSAKTRLQGIQSRCDAFFSKPVDAGRFIDKIDQMVAANQGEPFRVLIVDDSATQSMFHSSILNQAGIATAVCTNPLDILQPLSEFQPDLVLLDMYMPNYLGTEIAAMIRQHDAYTSLPVVYLSAETNAEKQLAAMRKGGDDFLAKPIKPDHLVSTVSAKIERARVMRSFMLCDSMTGLYNHTTTKKMLEAELSRATRYNQPLCFAMVDIDKFKSVNDTYGHPTGDRVIKSLARLLKQSLRKSDIVGRYGGEEFAVILPQTDPEAAEKLMTRILANFREIVHYAEGSEVTFNSTFSCGVAYRTEVSTASEMNNVADACLYDAKRGGRNQVVVAAPQNSTDVA